jgi:DNA-binding NtrC family response regulator
MDPGTLLSQELQGVSPAMRALRERLLRVARTRVPVLLTGETGTGKTTAAHLLHRLSQRASQPWVKVNCSGIPESLLDSELFGHERGAFTGAVARRVGLLPQAHGGTLFLDEIGDLAPSGQAKLLTALDDGEIRPVGGERVTRVEFRLLSATSKALDEEMEAGRFRPDLFHRIALLRIHLPPLRDRREDLELLTRGYLRRLAARHGRRCPRLNPAALAYLKERPWPGNVRELAHLLEAALVLTEGAELLDRQALEEGAPERTAPPGGSPLAPPTQ